MTQTRGNEEKNQDNFALWNRRKILCCQKILKLNLKHFKVKLLVKKSQLVECCDKLHEYFLKSS